jgi:transposase
MNRTLRKVLRMETFEYIYDDYQHDKLSSEEAAQMLGVSVRHFLRLRDRYDEEGITGLKNRGAGRVSKRRAKVAEVKRVTQLYRQQYGGFNVRHFHEFAKRNHGLERSYTWTKGVLLKAGLVAPSKRGGPHRLKRPRKPMAGMMMHQDASKHLWFGGEYSDLVVTLDDATSEITSAFFCEEEGTFSSFRGIHETIVKHGLFCSFYTDRGSHYFYTAVVGGKVDKSRPTEVGRALKQLGIEHIAAYSPEARGRSERMFGTLQDRLVNELKLAGITTMIAANSYVAETYLPRHNKQFMKRPECEKSAFIPVAGFDIANILCSQEERVVASDNTVSYQGMKLQIPPSPLRHHFVKTQVRVHHYPDDTMAIFHGPREIGRYNQDGTLRREEKKIAA